MTTVAGRAREHRAVSVERSSTLAEVSVLTDDFVRQLINVGEVDLLVGLATHNNAKTVGPVVQAIQAGLLKCFPRERTAILNADGGSSDGTPDLVTGASINDLRRDYTARALRTLPSISTRYANSPSSETALHTILAAAELLRARACAVISPESSNIEPDWVARLLRPIYQDNFDFVTPVYRRHKFEGILVSNLVYPMTRALYGQRIREPYASEFGFSSRAGSAFLAQHAWRHEPGQFGTELEMLLNALAGGYRLSQSFLGAKSRSELHLDDLVAVMRQTAGVLFASLETNFAVWSANDGSNPLPTTGPEYEVTLDPVRVNRKRLKQMFSSGVAELEPVLRSILSPSTLVALQQAASLDEDTFQYPAELWVRTVYEFAASHHKSVISRDHIVQALVPLYRGRTFTFLTENRSASAEEIENNIENLCREFERLKPYLLEVWNGGK
jgi:glucosylglycerate synthase